MNDEELGLYDDNPKTPLQSNDKLSKAYKLYRLLCTGTDY